MKSTTSLQRNAFLLILAAVVTSAAPAAALPATAIGLTMSADVGTERGGSFLITYELRITNLGTEDVGGVVLEDDLARAFSGTSFDVVSAKSETASVRSDFDGRGAIALLAGTDALAAAESLDVTLVVRVRLSGARATVSNSALVRATAAGGAPVSDLSQDGTEPDPDWDGDPTNNNAPTIADLVATPRIGAAKEATSVVRTSADVYAVSYSIVVENVGQLPLSDVNVQENLTLAFPAPAEVRVASLRSVDLEVNPGFNGTTDLHLLSGADALLPGERGTVSLALTVSPREGGSWFENLVLASATSPDGAAVLDFSNAGKETDPDADGNPTNNDRPTDVLLAQTTLTGFAETTLRLAVLPIDFDVQTLLFNTVLRIDDLTARLDAKLTNTLFDLLTFSVSGPLGDVSASSSLTFNPSTLAFVSWQTNASLDVLGVAVTDTVYLTTPASSSYTLVRLSGTAAAFALQASVKFGLCPPAFWETTLCADWDWALCDTPLSACVSFDGTAGFESLTLTARGIPLFANVFGLAASLDVRIEYATDEKSVTPTVHFDPDWFVCPEIELLGEAVLTSPQPGISSIRIYGAKVEVPIGGVIFRVDDSFVDDKNAAVTGKAAYFEAFRIEASLESCCGSPGRIEGAVYFERSPAPSGGLFGVGLLEGEAEIRVTPHLLLALAAAVQSTSPNWTITARLRTLW